MAEELDILQLIDSAFPIGSFAHSAGFEAVWRLTEADSCPGSRSARPSIEQMRKLEEYVVSILGNTGTFQIPFLRNAFGSGEDFDLVAKEDRRLHVMMTNHVARRASIQQGTSLASLATSVYVHHVNKEKLRALDQRVASASMKGHLAVVFGVVCRILGLDMSRTAKYFLYSQLRSVVASAVRMGLLGPVKAQEIQNRLQGRLVEISEKCLSLEFSYISNPILDIAQNAHDKLFAKLFIS